jgi:hypothetical protein
MFTRVSAAIFGVGILIADAFAAHSGFPVAITTGPRPQPLMVNGKNHLVYELHLTNIAPIPVELLTLDVFSDDGTTALASYRDESLEKLAVPAENLLTSVDSDHARKVRTIGEGHSLVIFLDVPLEADAQPPRELHHRFSFSIRGNPNLDRTINGPSLAVLSDPPPVLHPPLRGSGWIAFNALSTHDHRRAFVPVDGKACIAQRFAIDWMRLGPDGRLFHDDSKSNTNFYGYGAEVLAVADARVSDLRDGLPDNGGSNERNDRHVTVDSAAGNYLTLDLGGGHFAVYAHLQPGTIKVKVGDKVKVGQVLALVGNTGNSDAPHLHFHVVEANSPLGAEGLAYELESFTQTGTVDGAEELLNKGQTWRPKPEDKTVLHKREFPVNDAVVNFP